MFRCNSSNIHSTDSFTAVWDGAWGFCSGSTASSAGNRNEAIFMWISSTLPDGAHLAALLLCMFPRHQHRAAGSPHGMHGLQHALEHIQCETLGSPSDTV